MDGRQIWHFLIPFFRFYRHRVSGVLGYFPLWDCELDHRRFVDALLMLIPWSLFIAGTGTNGQINKGRGRGTTLGASGGGHGGNGGRGQNDPYTGVPYGNLYEPDNFGSAGGGPSNQAGQFA